MAELSNDLEVSVTDKPRDLRFQVSADRSSASRRVRYVETNQGDAGDCLLCHDEVYAHQGCDLQNDLSAAKLDNFG